MSYAAVSGEKVVRSLPVNVVVGKTVDIAQDAVVSDRVPQAPILVDTM